MPNASQPDRDAERKHPKDRPGSQQPDEGRGDAGRQRPQDSNQCRREGGGSKGSQSNWSPGRSSTESEGMTPHSEVRVPHSEDEDRDPSRVDRDKLRKP